MVGPTASLLPVVERGAINASPGHFAFLMQRFQLLADALTGCPVRFRAEGGLISHSGLLSMLTGRLKIANSFQNS
jgi:hypothetical protein